MPSSHRIGPWFDAGRLGAGHMVSPSVAVVYGASINPNAEANLRLIVAAPELLAALQSAIKIVEEARREWDAAPNGMRAGKLLIALAGGCRGYRADIDAIHDVIDKAIED